MADFKDLEKEIAEFWDNNHIFQKTIDQPAKKGDYLFYDGPPFATGTPHYGHLVGSIMKDVVPRYYTMQGYRVERRWGWDCHGLPIENIVEKELGIKSKVEIYKLGIDKFNDICRSKVLTYVEEWEKIVKRLGRFVDMAKPYRTMDPDYMESVWWVFKSLYDQGLVYEGYKSMHICPRCETTLSQSEVAEGYETIKDLSLTAKFELSDEPGTYVLAWTTTPWTLIGNVALAVGADIDYVKVNSDGKKYILAKARFEALKDKFNNPEIIEEIKGQDLVGKKYRPLFDYYAQDEKLANLKNGWQFYTADFVNTDEGTGIVHIAPAFGEDDMNLGKEKNLPFVQHVKFDGTIKPEAVDFVGLHVKPIGDVQSTDVAIIKYLAKQELIFAKEQYEHSYPHCWRCHTPLINYATSSWFVSVTKIKADLLKYAKEINWVPGHIKDGRFGNWLEGARDWSISRQRFWASVIPMWQCDKCDEKKVFGSIAELKEASGQTVTDLHKHIVDKVTFACPRLDSTSTARQACGGTMTRIPDVLDTWFDSGSMPFAQFHYPFENKGSFDKKFPAQFIAEGIDQARTWFYYLHVISGAVKKQAAFKNVIANGIVVAEDGKKMSKSLNNYPDPNLIMEKYGADALRLYLLSSSVVLAEDLSFTEKDLQIVYRRFNGLLQNILNFYLMFAVEKRSGDELPKKLDNDLDKWIVSCYQILLNEVTEAMNEYNLVKATRPIFDFVDVLSTWYLRRSRDRFKGDDQADKEAAILTLGYILKQLAKVIAPFTPFTAEIIFKEFVSKEESVHLLAWPKYENKLVDKKVLEQMELVRKIVEASHALRSKAGIKVRQPLATVLVEKKSNLNKDYFSIIAEELNVEKIDIVEKIEAQDGWELGEVLDFQVALDKNLTPELKDKGVVREMIRTINNLRKTAGLKAQDKPTEVYQTKSDYLLQLVKKYAHELIIGTSAGAWEELTQEPTHQVDLEIEGEVITLGIK
jgi:isoleucyl-tRNA synthetase